MTQEEKFEEAKRLYETANADQRYVLESLFPELRESEDEIVIAALKSGINGLLKKEYHLKGIGGISFDRINAWLEKQGETFTKKDVDDAYIKGICDAKHEFEKQGEQKPNFCHHEVDLSDCSEEYRKAYYDGWNNCNMQHSQCNSELEDVAKCLINGMKFYYEDDEEATWGTDKWSMPVKYIIKVLEKQCEQKPADKVEPKFKIGDKVLVDGKVYTIKLVNEDNYIVDENGRDVQEHFSYTKDWKLYEQKPTAWSEEDETALGDALWCCKQAASIAKNENDMGNVWYAETWLKAIKDRVQPKQEWSEEDEGFLCKCLGALGNPNYCYEDGELECMRNWLKSLRPQNRWKPSDEQIKTLGKWLDDTRYKGDCRYVWPIFDSLYEQLKKLKA